LIIDKIVGLVYNITFQFSRINLINKTSHVYRIT